MRGAMATRLIRVTMAEAATVERLIVACFDPATGEGWPPDQVAPTLAMPGTWAVRADVSARAADPGAAGFFIARQTCDEAELLLIGVRPDLRRTGLGGRLLDKVLSDAGRNGVQHVFLEVRESNVPAMRLYSSRGFEIVGRRPGYYRSLQGGRQDALTMRRSS